MNVSVIIPLYNAEKYIAKAIDSCLSIKEVKEIIVIDDGYADNAKNIVKKYCDKYDFIKLLNHPNNENLGAGASRNLGIQNATQDYISFLDADDYYLPNRFTKDKIIFDNNNNADGSYNAIGAHFYTEKAKRQFYTTFTTDLTTVNPNVNPTPENLFDGLIGLIPDYSYFSIDGLTLNRKRLQENKLLFGDLRIHQDTVFLIKLSYVLKLYPAELQQAVAVRGVHEENRITTNNNQSQYLVNNNRNKMWSQILDWSVKNNLEKKYVRYIQNKCDYFKLLSQENMDAKQFILQIIKKPRLLKNEKYLALHRKYLDHLSFSQSLFRLRNLIIKFL